MFINKRELVQDQYGNIYEVEDGFWYSDTGHIVKWVLFLLFFAFIIFLFGGYTHARKRLRAGLPLLAYHRWLIPRSHRNPAQHQNHFTFYQTQNYDPNSSYPMNNYPAPPPVYNNDQPPQYQYPEEANKVPQAQTSNYAPQGASQGVPQGEQQTGVATSSGGPQLPPRAVTKVTNAFRWLKR